MANSTTSNFTNIPNDSEIHKTFIDNILGKNETVLTLLKEDKETCFLASTSAKLITGICAFLAFMISTNLIVKHLRYYSKPQEQKWILRLIFIVPIYAMTSWISLLLFGENANDAYVYLDTIRSCYEAFVIYCFLSLCFDGYLGGEARIVQQINGQPLPANRRTLTCCLKGRNFSINTLRFCKQATLQFCYVKIIHTVVTLVLQSKGTLHRGNFNPKYPYIYLFLLQNISVTIALWSLALFYLTTKELLQPFKPLLKFVTVKSVIFMAFWQGAIISLLEAFSVFDKIEGVPKNVVAEGWQHFLTTCEMLVAAISFWFAFTYKVYVVNPPQTSCNDDMYGNNFFSVAAPPSVNELVDQFRQSIDVRDVLRDTVHHFSNRSAAPYRVMEEDAVSGHEAAGAARGTDGNNNDDKKNSTDEEALPTV